MNPNAELITRFYTAFGQLDYETMKACYHAEAEFSDPVFPDLRGKQVGLMWTMLCLKAKDFSIRFSDVVADDARGSANWVARYTYSGSGRVVTNEIHAEFEFRDGLIFRHRDTFNLHRWLGMAMGPGRLVDGLAAADAGQGPSRRRRGSGEIQRDTGARMNGSALTAD